ncbi:MAG: FtsB family cell division protein [Agromyces sp.]
MKRPNAPLGDGKSGQKRRKPSPKLPSRPVVDSTALKSRARQLASTLEDERRHAAWLNGFRFSAFSLIMAGVLIVGVLSLVPRIQELVIQRQQIDALQSDISSMQADITAKQSERLQWNDKTYIETQARERLYFVRPGDVSYLVINDLTPADLTLEHTAMATDTVQRTQSQWLGTLLGSVWSAGNATVVPATEGAQ